MCNNSESITLLAERFPAAPSVEGGGEGRFALNDIPPALRVAIVSKTECLACIFLLFFFNPSPFYSSTNIIVSFSSVETKK